MLSYMTCGQRGNWSDSWFCNKQYDTLYKEQHVQTNEAQRVAEIKKMQQILYAQSPYLVTAYDATSEAVRSDHFACFVAQPNPGGVWLEQYGVYNYTHIKPASQAGNCGTATENGKLHGAVTATKAASSRSIGTAFTIGGIVVIVAALALLGMRLMRRRATVADRE
jgi:peptide/nickel transport system substrate-binding protein